MMIICSKEKKQKKTLWVNKHHDVASHLESFDVFSFGIFICQIIICQDYVLWDDAWNFPESPECIL